MGDVGWVKIICKIWQFLWNNCKIKSNVLPAGGGLMGYSTSELSEFGRALYRGGSPTDALLTSWGNQNHTALELFTLCARLYHGRAMKVLAKYGNLFRSAKISNFIAKLKIGITQLTPSTTATFRMRISTRLKSLSGLIHRNQGQIRRHRKRRMRLEQMPQSLVKVSALP